MLFTISPRWLYWQNSDLIEVKNKVARSLDYDALI